MGFCKLNSCPFRLRCICCLFNASHFMKLLTLDITNKFVLLSLNRNFNRLGVKLTTDARAVRPYFVQPAMRVGMWGGRSFYRPCAALRLLKTCLQIGLTLYEGSCARLAQTFTASPTHRITKSPPISRLVDYSGFALMKLLTLDITNKFVLFSLNRNFHRFVNN